MSNNKIKSVILAAGKGTRMKSDVPKVLHKIFDKPLLGYVLDAVKEFSDENFVIVGHKAEQVENYLKNFVNSRAILQEPQLGTADAVFKAYDYLKNHDGQVLVLCGDTPLLSSESIKKMLEHHGENKASVTVMSAVVQNPQNYGRMVRSADGNLAQIVEEKDATVEQKQIKEINAGVYVLNWQEIKNVFKELKCDNAQGEYYLTDIVKWAHKKGLKVQSYVVEDNDEILGINSRRQLSEAFEILNKKKLEKLMDEGVTIFDPKSVYISPETTIGSDTTILPGTYISGKNTIGKNCQIGPFARIRGDVSVEDFVKIGNFVEIKNSHIKSHTNVSHLSYIGDSELGENVNIGAGTITANYNHVTKAKNQTVIENGVSVGSNSVLIAPVKIEENAVIGALSAITKNIEKNSVALTRAPLRTITRKQEQ